MTSAQIRQSFLDFFREKKHTIVPSSPLLPDAPNLLFTNAGMNQFVPIFLGQQKPSWNPPRVADTQKCIRAGGKHNDLEDVGLDTYHHTFFEMLGNWSFGDYFKKEAIEWAWELVVERWGLPAQRLYATVYQPGPDEPSEFDQEAHDHWARLFQDADLDPKIHIVNGSKADNFWMMGDTGPCGPCSELHIDLTPDGDTRGALVNKEDPRCIEIWNLVFIQFNANPDGAFVPLPQRHVDTGMGFERVTAIIQGTRNLTDFSGTISNYETDVFGPIFDELGTLSGKKYTSTLPGSALVSSASGGVSPPEEAARDAQQSGRDGRSTQIQIDIAFRVIADHIRALSFAIADGIIPSNEGRGYVLRRILRRAVRYGRALGFHEPFFFKLVDVLAKTMGDAFPEVRSKQQAIQETIRREEESFNKTLDKGIALFEKAITGRSIEPRGVLMGYSILDDADPGHEFIDALEITENAEGTRNFRIKAGLAFRLYDTYGFPLDLTQLMARERGLTVDVTGFERLMEQQRERGRKAQKKSTITVQHIVDFPTEFVGYKTLKTDAKLFKIVEKAGGIGSGDKWAIVDVSPFYAESGGQVGDTGELRFIRDGKVIRVVNTLKESETFYLKLADVEGFDWSPEAPLHLSVDAPRRRVIEGHHTVTHLLHWALHEVVSRDATQKGSYVGPDKLTFDFSSAALTPEQKRDVEKVVNEKIAENAPVSWTEIPYADAKKRKEIQQFFGEKYGDLVRVVQVGGEPKKLNGYSMELCGGTHVRSTSEIGAFRIVKEEAIAAGTRRIEAVAGGAARAWTTNEATRQEEKFQTLSRKKSDLPPLPLFTDTAQTNEMLNQIDARAAHLEKLDVDVREWEKKHAKEAEADLRGRGSQIANDLASSKVGEKICVVNVPEADAKLLQAVADALKSKFDGPIVLAGTKDGNVAIVAIVPKQLISQFQANKIIQQIAPIVGGKGGGRPESAQGAGKDISKVGQVLDEARRILGGNGS
jgi:alanyl-tRNA synthetase